MLNIVIPLAGRGSRFVDAGYEKPKPFIDVYGKPMIQRVIENLTPYEPYRFIFLARREHEEYIKKHMSFATNVIYVDEVTDGAACTVLLAKELINSQDPLLIANSDQLVTWNDMDRVRECQHGKQMGTIRWQESDNVQDMINDAVLRGMQGAIATFYATHPKWSYAKLCENNDFVREVAEKKVISNHATAGVYWFKHGSYFVESAEQMIRKDIRTNGEFYVCPVFNEMIRTKGVGVYPIYSMSGLGTPEDLAEFEKLCEKNGWT